MQVAAFHHASHQLYTKPDCPTGKAGMYVPAAQQGTGPQDAQWDLSAQCHQVATT